MEISVTQYKRCDMVKPVGNLDAYTAPDLEKTLDAILAKSRFKIVLDLGEVDFLSSRGLWVLVENQKKCKRYNRGEIVLANLHPQIKDTLKLAGLETYFNQFDDVITAVGSF
jgi:anti-sigma B factor antagonist